MNITPKIVNVASVPMRSPFRYPGGKTWLVPYIRAWLRSLSFRPSLFVEPFAGGGIVSLTVGFEDLASKVAMVELDEDIAAVWQTALCDDAEWLANKIKCFEVSTENVLAELDKSQKSIRQKAFQTILKNRTYHGGIMAHGSGLIKHGENGKGIKSRWYPDTLSKRILEISRYRGKFEFVETDGIEFTEKRVEDASTVFFIDPPYTAGGQGKRAGRRLYKYSVIDHERLFDAASEIRGDFLMTYDNDPEVKQMAKSRNFDMEVVPMKNTHHAKMFELLIGKNLDWTRAMLSPPAQVQLKLFE